MSDSQPESAKITDPLEQWRDLRDGYMGAWAKAMGEAVNSEAYAQTSGTMLETYLTASAPFRDAQKKAMLGALEQLHMPSQADFLSLADRMTNLELLLDDMDAKLDHIVQLTTSAAEKPAPQVNVETKSAHVASAGVKSAFEAKAAEKPVPVAKAETKPLFEARAEMKPLFESKVETKPLPEAKAAEKPALPVKAETKAAAPKKFASSAKKGSR